jgi:DNA-binding PadR family transcriptional regulator
VEKAGQRRRRYYKITAAGRKVLAAQREGWKQFAEAVRRIAGVDYA